MRDENKRKGLVRVSYAQERNGRGQPSDPPTRSVYHSRLLPRTGIITLKARRLRGDPHHASRDALRSIKRKSIPPFPRLITRCHSSASKGSAMNEARSVPQMALSDATRSEEKARGTRAGGATRRPSKSRAVAANKTPPRLLAHRNWAAHWLPESPCASTCVRAGDKRMRHGTRPRRG